MKSILCFGDSNTYGSNPDGSPARHPYGVRWTSRLQQILGSVSAAQEAAANAQQAAQEAAASVSGLRGWSLTEEADGTVTIDHAAEQSTAETTN